MSACVATTPVEGSFDPRPPGVLTYCCCSGSTMVLCAFAGVYVYDISCVPFQRRAAREEPSLRQTYRAAMGEKRNPKNRRYVAVAGGTSRQGDAHVVAVISVGFSFVVEHALHGASRITALELAESSDGRCVAVSGDEGGVVCLLDITRGTSLRLLAPLDSSVLGLAAVPDDVNGGIALLVAFADGVVLHRINTQWQVERSVPILMESDCRPAVSTIASKWLAVARPQCRILVIDACGVDVAQLTLANAGRNDRLVALRCVTVSPEQSILVGQLSSGDVVVYRSQSSDEGSGSIAASQIVYNAAKFRRDRKCAANLTPLSCFVGANPADPNSLAVFLFLSDGSTVLFSPLGDIPDDVVVAHRTSAATPTVAASPNSSPTLHRERSQPTLSFKGKQTLLTALASTVELLSSQQMSTASPDAKEPRASGSSLTKGIAESLFNVHSALTERLRDATGSASSASVPRSSSHEAQDPATALTHPTSPVASQPKTTKAVVVHLHKSSSLSTAKRPTAPRRKPLSRQASGASMHLPRAASESVMTEEDDAVDPASYVLAQREAMRRRQEAEAEDLRRREAEMRAAAAQDAISSRIQEIVAISEPSGRHVIERDERVAIDACFSAFLAGQTTVMERAGAVAGTQAAPPRSVLPSVSRLHFLSLSFAKIRASRRFLQSFRRCFGEESSTTLRNVLPSPEDLAAPEFLAAIAELQARDRKLFELADLRLRQDAELNAIVDTEEVIVEENERRDPKSGSWVPFKIRFQNLDGTGVDMDRLDGNNSRDWTWAPDDRPSRSSDVLPEGDQSICAGYPSWRTGTWRYARLWPTVEPAPDAFWTTEIALVALEANDDFRVRRRCLYRTRILTAQRKRKEALMAQHKKQIEELETTLV